MASQVYPSDLSDAEREMLAPLILPPKPGGRPRSVGMRRILNGIFYILRDPAWRLRLGAWVPGRYLPRAYGLWPTVCYYFRRWRRDGTWECIHT